MTVKEFVMLLTSQSILAANGYKKAGPIVPIFCKDGTDISVQCHAYAHAKFADVPTNDHYPEVFGRDLVMAETNCEDLDCYGIDTIEDIENYVNSHGGIDIPKTVEYAVNLALRYETKNKTKRGL